MASIEVLLLVTCSVLISLTVGLAAPAPAETGKPAPTKPDYVAMQAAVHRSAKEYSALRPLKAPPASPGVRMGLTVLPVNLAAFVNGTVRLACEASQAPPYSRVQWFEDATNRGFPQLISDNEVILPYHPNSARYSIIQDTNTQFHLVITGIRMADAGAYVCVDAAAGPPDDYQGLSELVVLQGDPECDSNIGNTGEVVESYQYTISCRMQYSGYYSPLMTWTGPQPYGSATIPSAGEIASGVYFTAERGHDAGTFRLKTNFTARTVVPPGVAGNAPDYEHNYSAPTLYVYWEPRNLHHSPAKVHYEVGDVITCFADAYPPAFYSWQNMITNETINSQTFTVDARYDGLNLTMRCQAQNLILGVLRSEHLFIDVFVPLEPRAATITPEKNVYAVGDVITCTVDANPPPLYGWQNFRTLEESSGQTFTVTANMKGYSDKLRCHAYNLIDGNLYIINAFITVSVSGHPENTRAEPLKDTYAVGDVITCTADARPEASYLWQNARTLVTFHSRTLSVTESMRGEVSLMRCEAQNIIAGEVFSQSILLYVVVPA